MATSPTTPGVPGKHVNPFAPSRRVVMLPFASISITLAFLAISGGATDNARLTFVSAVSPAWVS